VKRVVNLNRETALLRCIKTPERWKGVVDHSVLGENRFSSKGRGGMPNHRANFRREEATQPTKGGGPISRALFSRESLLGHRRNDRGLGGSAKRCQEKSLGYSQVQLPALGQGKPAMHVGQRWRQVRNAIEPILYSTEDNCNKEELGAVKTSES